MDRRLLWTLALPGQLPGLPHHRHDLRSARRRLRTGLPGRLHPLVPDHRRPDHQRPHPHGLAAAGLAERRARLPHPRRRLRPARRRLRTVLPGRLHPLVPGHRRPDHHRPHPHDLVTRGLAERRTGLPHPRRRLRPARRRLRTDLPGRLHPLVPGHRRPDHHRPHPHDLVTGGLAERRARLPHPAPPSAACAAAAAARPSKAATSTGPRPPAPRSPPAPSSRPGRARAGRTGGSATPPPPRRCPAV